jgi:hypothetical protein
LTDIKYSAILVHSDLHRIVKELAKRQGVSIVSYMRFLLMSDPDFKKVCRQLGINPTESPETDILCSDCGVTFRTAHGFNIHLGSKYSTCKQNKIPLVKKLIR